METFGFFKLFYFSLFVSSIVCVVILSRFLKNRTSFYYVALFCGIVIETFGYFKLSSVTSLDSAILANQILYLGSCCTPFFCMMCVRELCHDEHHRLIEIFCVIMGGLVFAGVLTIGKYPFYYKVFDLSVENGVVHIIKEYGSFHFLNPLYLLFSVVISAGIIIRSYKKKRHVSYITSTVLTISMSLTVVVYFVERIFKFQFEFLPLSFVMMQVSILVLLQRINRYDLLGVSLSTISESKSFGFVIFNSNGKLFGADAIARSWFPELDDLRIDRKIEKNNTDFLKLIENWIEKPEFNKPFYFERNDMIIEVKLTLADKDNSSFYCVNLRDDTKQQKISRLIQNYSRELELQISSKTAQLENLQNDIILSMASIVENRDANTGGHIKRTSDVVKIFVTHLASTGKFPLLTPQFSDKIIKAAPLHDFGKIGVPDGILNKAGKFEPEEYEKMKTHAEKGSVIVSEILRSSTDSRFREIAVNVAHFHHEKWDGTGYPIGLSRENIPFEARVMALADVFDALVSKRVYKERFSYEKAFSIIEESCGTHFDPLLCKEFLKCRSELEKLFDSYAD